LGFPHILSLCLGSGRGRVGLKKLIDVYGHFSSDFFPETVEFNSAFGEEKSQH
jgi:hypothetical protein